MGLFSSKKNSKQDTAAEESGSFSRPDDDDGAERVRSKRASNAGQPAVRRGRDAKGADPVLSEKKRARRRLVGAIALALAVAIGLPMLLDAEPKQPAIDLSIQIPSKERAPALPLPVQSAQQPPAPVPSADAGLDKREEIIAPPRSGADANSVAQVTLGAVKPELARSEAAAPALKSEHKTDVKAEAKPESKAEPKLEHKAEPKAELKADLKSEHKNELKADAKAEHKADAKAAEHKSDAPVQKSVAKADDKTQAAARAAKAADDALRAAAILEGRPVEKLAAPDKPALDKALADKAASAEPSTQRYLLQVAALGTQKKVTELQERLKEAGIKTFTQKVSTPSGELIQVRLGPFSKDESDKMRAKLEKLHLSPKMVTL
jgi:DedD protein